jgi:GH35 family endo-1,4-beta-xylanase
MRTTYLTKTTASNFKSAALALLVFATSFTACKSSLDDDLTPTSETQNETVMAASDLDEVAEAGSYHLKNKTLRGSFNFPIGAAVVKELLDDPSYANTIIKDFSRLSSESNFKFGSLHPAENKYTYEKADAIVAFAQKHNMQVTDTPYYGHTTVTSQHGY